MPLQGSSLAAALEDFGQCERLFRTCPCHSLRYLFGGRTVARRRQTGRRLRAKSSWRLEPLPLRFTGRTTPSIVRWSIGGVHWMVRMKAYTTHVPGCSGFLWVGDPSLAGCRLAVKTVGPDPLSKETQRTSVSWLQCHISPWACYVSSSDMSKSNLVGICLRIRASKPQEPWENIVISQFLSTKRSKLAFQAGSVPVLSRSESSCNNREVSSPTPICL